MLSSDVQARLDALLTALRTAGWKEREALKEALLGACREHADEDVLSYLDGARRGLPLEARWEVDEVIEVLTPPPPPPPEEPEPEPEPEPEAPRGQLRMSDLVEVYSDPRGIALFTDKTGKRWFLSQIDPYNGQPMMAEIPPGQIEQVKAQLRGSPYWRIGSGVTP